MTVVKITASGKGFLVVDDDGNVFITPVQYVEQLLQGSNKQGFLLLTRLPNKASDTRFKKSPVFDAVEQKANPVTAGTDSLARKPVKEQAETLFKDTATW